MRVLLAVLLCAVMGLASAADSYRFDRGVVVVGDTIASLVQRAGQPDRTVQLENRFGAAAGERWEYYESDGKVVAFVISGSRVVAIEEAR